MNYLVDLQTSKAKHCTARCRGNPSGTFPILVWGWRGFQTGSGGVSEQTWPEGSGPGSVRLLFPLAARSLPPARAARGLGLLAWGSLATAPAGRPALPIPCRLRGTAGHDHGGVLPALPASPPTSPPPHLALSAQPVAKLRAEVGGEGEREEGKQ